MSWQTELTARLGIDHPIIQAPMAGGTTTPALVAAVSNAGALGSIGAGYMAPDDLATAIAETSHATDKPFAVNLFIPQPFQVNEDRIEQANARLDAFRDELGLARPAAPARYAPDFDAQFDAVLNAGVAVFSSTFGALDRPRIQALQGRGTCVVGTATTVAEARALAADGVDMIVAQGSDAGGHRGTFIASAEQSMIGTLSLVPQIADAVDVPVIASGGVMDGRGMAACRMLGAAGVQMGSAFLTCTESGAKPAHKKALLEAGDRPTAVTRAFSGKAARGLNNRFIEEMAPIEASLPDYPVHNAWTKDIRATAGQADRDAFMSLWAGQAASLARSMTAAELVDTLMREYDACVRG